MKYRAKVSYPGVEAGTIFYPFQKAFGEIAYSENKNPVCTNCNFLSDWDVRDSHYFEPIPERLTSEEEDEAARRYMWVPKRGANVFRIDIALSVVPQNWIGLIYDWFCFRSGMVFRTKAEAERAAELMINGRI